MQAEQKELVRGSGRKLDGKEATVDDTGWRDAEFDREPGDGWRFKWTLTAGASRRWEWTEQE
jgi:hypothetical protein